MKTSVHFLAILGLAAALLHSSQAIPLPKSPPVATTKSNAGSTAPPIDVKPTSNLEDQAVEDEPQASSSEASLPNVGKIVKETLESVSDAAGGATGAVGTVVSTVLDNASGVLPGAVKPVAATLDKLTSATNAVGPLVNTLGKTVAAVPNLIKPVVGQVLGITKDLPVVSSLNVAGTANNALGSATDGVGGALRSATNSLGATVNSATGVLGGVLNSVTGVADGLGGLGKAVSSTTNELGSTLNSATGALNGVLNASTAPIGALQGKSSPLATITNSELLSLATKLVKVALALVQGLNSPLPNNVGTPVSNLGKPLENLGGTLHKVIEPVGTLTKPVGRLGNPIKELGKPLGKLGHLLGRKTTTTKKPHGAKGKWAH